MTCLVIAVVFVRPRVIFWAICESWKISFKTKTKWSEILRGTLCSAMNPVNLISAFFTDSSNFCFSDGFCRHCAMDLCDGARFFFLSVCFLDFSWFFKTVISATIWTLQQRQAAFASFPGTGFSYPAKVGSFSHSVLYVCGLCLFFRCSSDSAFLFAPPLSSPFLSELIFFSTLLLRFVKLIIVSV